MNGFFRLDRYEFTYIALRKSVVFSKNEAKPLLMMRQSDCIVLLSLFVYLMSGFWLLCKFRRMADDQELEGSNPVDLNEHPSGIVPTLQ